MNDCHSARWLASSLSLRCFLTQSASPPYMKLTPCSSFQVHPAFASAREMPGKEVTALKCGRYASALGRVCAFPIKVEGNVDVVVEVVVVGRRLDMKGTLT